MKIKDQESSELINSSVYCLAVVTSLAHLLMNYFAFLPENWTASIHFALFGSLAALQYLKHNIARCLVILAIVSSVIYLILAEDALYIRGQNFNVLDYVFSSIAIVFALVLTYRVIGWFIPCLIVLSLTYITVWGQYVGGVFNFRGLSWETLLFRNYFSPDGMFGSIAQLSWTFVFMFVLFGAFLQVSGAGSYLLCVATRLASRLKGGSGIVAVIASGLMGSVSGSAIANTAATGVITIPAMRKAGYSPAFAGGVEAAASTGGQLMPPIMGAGAFIMASYTQLPYLTIISAALLPALLYYLTVGFFVRAYAIKHQVDMPSGQRLDVEVVQDYGTHGWRHLVPIAILVACLIIGFTPLYAVGVAIVSIVSLSWLSNQPMRLKEVFNALAEGAKGMTVTAVLLVTIGLLVNAITTTGIGNTFSLMALQWSAGSLIILLLLIALASLILGAGLPVTASYIIVATLLAPVLSDLISTNLLDVMVTSGLVSIPQELLGTLLPSFADGSASLSDAVLAVPQDTRNLLYEITLSSDVLMSSLLASHLIIFWLSQDSNVTPPVCLVAYTAAGIANASHNKTAFCAWKLAKGLYLVPLLMAFTSLIMGDIQERLYSFLLSAVGLFFLVSAWEGVYINTICVALRLLFGCAGVFLLWPSDIVILQLIKMILACIVIVFMFASALKDKKQAPHNGYV